MASKTMTHPAGGRIEVADSAVATYESQGWEVVKAAAKKTAKTAAAKKTASTEDEGK